MFPNRTVKATSKWRNAVDEFPTTSGVYLTAWANGSAKWNTLVQWFDANEKEWERNIPDMWAKINLPWGK